MSYEIERIEVDCRSEIEALYLDHHTDRDGKPFKLLRGASRLIGHVRIKGQLVIVDMLVSKELQYDKAFMKNFVACRVYQKAEIIYNRDNEGNSNT